MIGVDSASLVPAGELVGTIVVTTVSAAAFFQ
jgi:hypothetical protein